MFYPKLDQETRSEWLKRSTPIILKCKIIESIEDAVSLCADIWNCDMDFKKGVAGEGTGGLARKAIRNALNKGIDINRIAQVAGRSVSTIRQILRGDIVNPPPELVTAINRL